MFETSYCSGTSAGSTSLLLKNLLKESCRLPIRIILQLMQSKFRFNSKPTPSSIVDQIAYSSTTINQLPNEVIVKIFSYCTDADLPSLRLQCSRFNELILACPSSLIRCHRQRLVTCLTISYVQDEDRFLLATFKKSHSSRKNCMTISRQDILNGNGQNLRFCFRRFRILGLQFSNVPLCSQSVNFFCDMLSSCRALEPKTLRVCDCYVADLTGSDMLRLMKLCGSHLIVLSFMNLAGVHSTLLCDELFSTATYSGLYVLMIQSIDFHFSVPLRDQYLQISDVTLARLPSTMRKVKLEKCANITADGVCQFVERYFGNEPSTSSNAHRSSELVFKQCDQLTTASFEREAQRRRIPIEGHDSDEYIMKWVKRRQYHIRKANERRLLSVEIDSYRPTRSGISSPANVDDLSRNSVHSIATLGSLYPDSLPVVVLRDQTNCKIADLDSKCALDEQTIETAPPTTKTRLNKQLILLNPSSCLRNANIIRPFNSCLFCANYSTYETNFPPHFLVKSRDGLFFQPNS